MNRRDFLGRSAALAALGLSRPARATRRVVLPSQRKFVFVMADGGWDPSLAMVPTFEHPLFDPESGAELLTVGRHSWVSHADRPSVDRFLERTAHQLLQIDGLLVPSVAHDICKLQLLTGGADEDIADTATVLGADGASSQVLPHLVLSGPCFPGRLGSSVGRSGKNDQLQSLVTGDVLELSDTPVSPLSAGATAIVDRYLAERGEARLAQATAGERDLVEAWLESRDRAQVLRERLDAEAISTNESLAAEVLASSLSRCVSLSFPSLGEYDWDFDSHANNRVVQSTLMEGLFSKVLGLMDQLEALPGDAGGTLLDETVFVIWSEMGRTPFVNGGGGRDHWPYTSVLLAGPGLHAGTIGGYDDGFQGVGVDPLTGMRDDAGDVLSTSALRATLLALGGVDPGRWTDAQPLWEVLA